MRPPPSAGDAGASFPASKGAASLVAVSGVGCTPPCPCRDPRWPLIGCILVPREGTNGVGGPSRAFGLVFMLAGLTAEESGCSCPGFSGTLDSSGGGVGVMRVPMDARLCSGERGGPLLVRRRLPGGAVCCPLADERRETSSTPGDPAINCVKGPVFARVFRA